MSVEGETFFTRLSRLLQKSRKALRLYSSMSKVQAGKAAEYTEMQITEWREVNAELLGRLTTILEQPSKQSVVAEVFHLRDRFYTEWRMTEADLHSLHKQLVTAVENADFVKAATASRKLVALKARVQATQAAHQEIQAVIDTSKLAQPTIELPREKVVNTPEPEQEQEYRSAKVIPLRRNGRS